MLCVQTAKAVVRAFDIYICIKPHVQYISVQSKGGLMLYPRGQSEYVLVLVCTLALFSLASVIRLTSVNSCV